MSTSAESATLWVKTKHPSADTIREMTEKLAQRIEKSGLPDDQLQGSIEALDVLETVLANLDSPQLSPDTYLPKLDTSNLVSHDHQAAREMSPEEKRRQFAELKQRLQR